MQSIQSLKSRSLKVIAQGIQIVIDKHNQRGFNITNFHADPKFGKQGFHDFLRLNALHIWSNIERLKNNTRTVTLHCSLSPVHTISQINSKVINGTYYVLDEFLPK